MEVNNYISLIAYKINAYFIRKSSIHQLRKLRNSHLGERCFIIGNGPSLKPEDLDLLKGEFCFASNRIDKIYEFTDWRPTFYCTQDVTIIQTYRDIISQIRAPYKLMVYGGSRKTGYIGKAMYTPFGTPYNYPEPPTFSEDISCSISEGYTVTYTCMQVAAYMGFKEIVLLGIDHNFPVDVTPDGQIVVNKDAGEHFYGSNNIARHYPMLYKVDLAYQIAKEYAEQHGIRIINATRGGKLEIFERQNLETLLTK